MPPAPAPEPRALETPEALEDVRAAQRGDADAFGRLYRRHVGRVHALALRLTADRGRAEELVQDAFVRAWEKLGSFRGESAFGTWLHRLTVNVFLVQVRSHQRRGAHEELPGELPEPALDVEGEGLGREGRMDLEAAIARLSPGARTAFVLHELEGYSHEEIAAMSGVAAATIRAQLFRARKRLLEVLER
ncbi:MAG: sigma-70 family RNA polymerase sigma factor [Gemmatimonadetes bacterium]|nr:sigma-70 family RNA polymerase sigma factor [Gemmatimonadota bacterium]